MEDILEKVSIENPLRKLVQDKPLIYHSSMPAETFDQFVLENEDLRIERDKNGTIIIHPHIGYDSAINEGAAFMFFSHWGFFHKDLGDCLSPSASFNLPDGSQHKADGAWVSKKRAEKMPEGERKKIPHVVPDFVMEVRSQTDRLVILKKKMEETWIANGVKLAWLIDPYSEKVWVYRADGTAEKIETFDMKLSGEDVLPGFELDLNLLKAKD